jgi:hypothetical protein
MAQKAAGFGRCREKNREEAMRCPCCGTSRREVLAMLGATAALGSSAFAQGGGPRIIDTHHHIYPPK